MTSHIPRLLGFNPIWGGYGIWSSALHISPPVAAWWFQSYLRWIWYLKWHARPGDSRNQLTFQSYLRWIWYLKSRPPTRLPPLYFVSILFEVDMVFEAWAVSYSPRSSECFNPIWGGYGIWSGQGDYTPIWRQTRFNPIWGGYGIWSNICLIDGDTVVMFQSYLRWIWYLKKDTYGLLTTSKFNRFNPIWGGYGIWSSDGRLIKIETICFNPIWGGYGIWSKSINAYLWMVLQFQSYLRWIWYLKSFISVIPFIYPQFQSYLRWIWYLKRFASIC